MTDLSDVVARSLSPETRATFLDRVDEQAAFLHEAVAEGALDNDEFAIGLEMEVYAVESTDEPRLVSLPAERFTESDAVTKELGVHNAEINTDPSVFDDAGLADQAATIREQTADARAAVAEDGDLVLDAMWTVPPAGGAHEYLTDTDDQDGLAVAANMRPAPRYVAIDEAIRERADGTLTLSVPGADLQFPSILYESLATSIQPHLQIPDSADLSDYYNAGIRTLGPLLALSTNSPFLPGEYYDTGDPRAVVEDTHHELRIAVFEQSVNYTENPKVRVPEDIGDTGDVIDGVVADDLIAPFLREWIEDGPAAAYTDNYWEFEHKRGTYWRWLRCVIGGDPVGSGDERSVRIEYRPLPTQPTVTDVVALQALTVGLLRGLVAADHPITDLPWADAEASFYSAAEEGLDADLAWITADGRRTTDHDTVFAEVFEYAAHGLDIQGVEDPKSSLEPIRARWEAGTTPSQWKKDRVRTHLDDGATLQEAITEMQRAYVKKSAETDSFTQWL